jgi:hypothetical protein
LREKQSVFLQIETSAIKSRAYGNSDSGIDTIRYTAPIWVSISPEVKQNCSKTDFGTHNLNLRLAQLLGMKPADQFTYFVTMKAAWNDLLRPTAVTKVDTPTADTDTVPDSAPASYKAWFAAMESTESYANGYQWTLLLHTIGTMRYQTVLQIWGIRYVRLRNYSHESCLGRIGGLDQ